MVFALRSELSLLKSLARTAFQPSFQTGFRYFNMKSEEFRIPVPWGFVAGQIWGSPESDTWVALHGWLDNSGSFDTLAPFFVKDNKRLIAIDLPGHGFSSHYPSGIAYPYLDGVIYIRHVAEYFRLKKVNLVSHSMGGGMSMLFAATYPEFMGHLIMLDCVKPISRSVETVVRRTRDSVDDLFTIQAKLSSGKQIEYAKDDALNRLVEATDQLHGVGSVPRESCEILLKRGCAPVHPEDPNSKVVFTRDLKHRITSIFGYPTDVISAFAEKIQCKHLIVKAKAGSYYEPKTESETILQVYKSKNKTGFKYVEVEGSHHVHLNQPEVVWKEIEDFLMNPPVPLNNHT